MKNIQEILQGLKQELYNAKKKTNALNLTDEARLYYSGVIAGLQVAIGKYEQWYYGTQPPRNRKKGAQRGK